MTAEIRPGKIRTVIVDDEPLARSNLSVLLRLDPEIEIVSECGSGVDAPSEIRRTRPDLLFLDVQMPECDGFDVLELLGKDVPAAVVFVTAYDQYALRAFEAGALDYLLKPFDNARFDRAVDRAKQKIAREKDQPRKLEFLAIKSAGQVHVCKPAGDRLDRGCRLLRGPARRGENSLAAPQYLGIGARPGCCRLLPYSSVDDCEPQPRPWSQAQ